MRLAVFVDQVFWRDGDVLSTDKSHILFLESFINSVDEIVLIGREAPEPGRAPYVLDHPAITFLPVQIRQTIRQHAESWNAILIGGPHPIGQMIARQCVALGVLVVLVVRENFVQQMSAHHDLKQLAALALQRDFKRLARGRTVLAVGMEMAEEYRRFTDRVYNHFPCLVDEAQFRLFSAMWAGSDLTRLICVDRLAPEKGFEYLFEALVQLSSALARAIERAVRDGGLRERLRRNGCALMSDNTLEANRARILGILHDEALVGHA